MNKMTPLKRKAFYYETDKMGIVHHSNYIRWFEEARIDFLNKAGFSYAKMEKIGLMIPVLSAECNYKNSVHFDEEVYIIPHMEMFNGFKMEISYKVVGVKDNELKATGTTRHFFTDMNLKPVRTNHKYPEVYKVFADYVGVDIMAENEE